MELDKFTQKAQQALVQSQQLASDLHHQNIEPAHLLLALLQQEQGVVPAVVTKVAGSPIALREEVQQELDNRSKVFGATGQPASPVKLRRLSAQQIGTPKGWATNISRRNTSYWD